MSRMPQPGNRGRLAAAIGTVALAAGVLLSGASAGASGPVESAATALESANAPVSELQPERTVNFGNLTITRYQQTLGGIPVINGDVSVMDSPSAEPTVVSDGTTDVPAAAPVAKAATAAAPAIGAHRAIAIARASTGAHALRVPPTAALAIDPKRGLVRRVELASSQPMKDFEVLVDATSGEVLATRNRLQDATAHAQVYTPNPVANNGGYSGIGKGRGADNHDQDTPLLTALRQPVSFFVNDGQDCLVGPDVEARVGRGNGHSVCDSSLDWSGVTRSDNRFEALEAYTQIAGLASYYHSLGFTGSADFHPQRQRVIADAFPDDNSFYSPNDRTIRYGTGGVDDAEDGDVVVHEYGHAIQDAQVSGFGSTDQAAALGEGFGDYQSALNLLRNSSAGYIDPSHRTLVREAKCIFDWDGTSGYGGFGVAPCGRLASGTDGTRRYRQARRTCSLGAGREEVHCLGEVWSHGLIDLMLKLPRVTIHSQSGVPPVAVDVLASQFAYADNETFKQAVNALVAADKHIFGGTHVHAICHEMKHRRGINAASCR